MRLLIVFWVFLAFGVTWIGNGDGAGVIMLSGERDKIIHSRT